MRSLGFNKALYTAKLATLPEYGWTLIPHLFESKLNASNARFWHNISILSIGKKSSEYFKNNNYTPISTHDEVFNNLNYESIAQISDDIMQMYLDEKFDKVILVYNQFKNVITQIPQAQQIIPLNTKSDDQNNSDDNYEFEPDEDEILSNLLPKNISTQIFKAMLENSASEQGSRMTAMDNATRNAGDLVDKLTIQYNRSRQAAITKELIEIISGAESL